MTHAARALQSHDLSGEVIKLWITYILFWPHKDMGGLSEWVISSMPGPPPRQHKHERRYTPSTHPLILTRLIWKEDYGAKMILGDLAGLKLADICITGEKKLRKTSPRKLLPTGDRTWARCVTGAHATACSTAVDSISSLLLFLDLWVRNFVPSVCMYLCMNACMYVNIENLDIR